MAGKTKIDGTNYTIKGGRTKIDGTDYTIMCGKTKISGTNYNISFGKVLAITGTYTHRGYICCYVLNGNDFTTDEYLEDGTYTFDNSTKLTIGAYAKTSAYDKYCRIYLNGTVVQTDGFNTYYVMTNLNQYNTISIRFTPIDNYSFYCYITTT